MQTAATNFLIQVNRKRKSVRKIKKRDFVDKWIMVEIVIQWRGIWQAIQAYYILSLSIYKYDCNTTKIKHIIQLIY